MTGKLYILDLGLSSFPCRNGRIMSCQPDGSSLKEIVTDLQTLPDGVAVDSANGHIYWTNMGERMVNDGSIQRCDISGGNIRTIVPPGRTHTPKQLKIANQKLYWCDREGMQVMRANLDGSEVEVLHRAGVTEEDREDRRNWCVGDDPRSNNVTVLLDHLPEPIDLDLDIQTNTLYWSDRGDPPFGNSINAAQLDAVGRMAHLAARMLVRKLHEGIGLSLDLKNRRMFFGDLLGGVYSSGLDGTNKQTLFAELGDITGILYVED
ncbi:low-density lipoprotein receptor-related protein 6 [Aspergillus awamori]|uniref:Low-density lipoprotein receptor-related protein 6 n=1 Tax=Aspergillus awamori TaxID=105351 RepID=A0A401L7E0_ASPAW|nr:low-density lipoprotein receptor-related protein 6 [Aspergillus awamori]